MFHLTGKNREKQGGLPIRIMMIMILLSLLMHFSVGTLKQKERQHHRIINPTRRRTYLIVKEENIIINTRSQGEKLEHLYCKEK